jgi:hypothetical protein
VNLKFALAEVAELRLIGISRSSVFIWGPTTLSASPIILDCSSYAIIRVEAGAGGERALIYRMFGSRKGDLLQAHLYMN